MQRKPLNVAYKPQMISQTTTMAQKGVDKHTFSQFLNLDLAKNIENYLPTSEGRLKTRKGLLELLNLAGSTAGTMAKSYIDDIILYAYGTTLGAYTISTDSYTTIKSDFVSDSFDGRRYGDYFFLTSKLNGLWRVSRTITYNQRTTTGSTQSKFTIPATGGAIGATITGAGGATANVVSSSGTTPGTLTVVVDTIVGTFVHGEVITSGTLVGATLTNINPFTTGKKVTGQTSGATAIILEHTDSGATGTITLGSVSGTFQNGEELVDDSTAPYGRGTATSVLTWTTTADTSAPKAGVCEVIGNRFYLGDLAEDETAVRYSNADTGANPVFTSWTVGTGINDPGQINYRNGGQVMAIKPLNGTVTVLQKKGKFAFYINIAVDGGVYYKEDKNVGYREDLGASRACITTDQGLFYADDSGLYQLISIGEVQQTGSNQEANISSKLLGNTYFEDIDLTNADMAFDARNRLVLLTCAKRGTTNNFVIVYNIDSKAFSFISGWAINRFLSINQDIYGLASDTMAIYKCFEGYSDNGFDISRYYEQEIPLGTMYTKNFLKGCYAQGEFSLSSELNVKFDIYNNTGRLERNKAEFTWTAQNPPESTDGYGAIPYGGGSYGGDADVEGLINSFDGCRPKVRNVQRLVMRIDSTGQDYHTINWVGLQVEVGSPIRVRKMARQ